MRQLSPVDLKGVRHDSNTVAVSSISLTSLYSAATASFRSMKVTLQATLGTDYVVREFLCIHNGTDGFITEYAIVSSNESSSLMSDVFSANVATGNFHLYVTAASASARTFVVSVQLL